MRRLLAAAIVLSLACAPSVWANLLQNPGFENAEPGTGTNCQYWTWDVPSGWTHGGQWGQTDVQGWRAHSGTNEGTSHAWGWEGGDGGWWQEVTNSYGAGSIWEAGVWLCNDNGGWGGGIYTNAYTHLKIEFYDGSFAMIGGATNAITLPGETWTYFSVQGTAPVNTAWSRWVITAGGQGTSGALQFDDASLAVIPEPISMALLGIGVAGFYVLRSRRK